MTTTPSTSSTEQLAIMPCTKGDAEDWYDYAIVVLDPATIATIAKRARHWQMLHADDDETAVLAYEDDHVVFVSACDWENIVGDDPPCDTKLATDDDFIAIDDVSSSTIRSIADAFRRAAAEQAPLADVYMLINNEEVWWRGEPDHGDLVVSHPLAFTDLGITIER